MKCALVPVLLHERPLAFRFLIASAFSIFHVLSESLFLRQRASSLNLLSFEFSPNFSLLVTFDALQLSQPPCLEFGFRVKIIGVIYVGNLGFLLLYSKSRDNE